MIKFYEIMKSENTKRYNEHVVFFTTIGGAINWLKSAGITKAHDICGYAELHNASWYYANEDDFFEDILNKTYIENGSTNYTILERTFEA